METYFWGELPYIVKYPVARSTSNPTIIFLHGAGTRGRDISVLERNSFLGVNSCISDKDSPFMVFAPLCTKDSWYDVFEQLQEFVNIVVARPEVDESRLYLVGNSMGGYGAWQLAMTMPEYFAALVPICGGGMRWNVGRLIHIPVWAFHGREDKTVPVQESILMVDGLNKAGGKARLTIMEDTGHNCWDAAYGMKKLFDWMLSQKKTGTATAQNNKYADSKLFG